MAIEASSRGSPASMRAISSARARPSILDRRVLALPPETSFSTL